MKCSVLAFDHASKLRKKKMVMKVFACFASFSCRSWVYFNHVLYTCNASIAVLFTLNTALITCFNLSGLCHDIISFARNLEILIQVIWPKFTIRNYANFNYMCTFRWLLLLSTFTFLRQLL